VTDYIKVTPINLVGKDERGATYDYSLPNRNDFIFISRKAGAESGNTYHEGKSAMTNPKIFVLLMGEIKFTYRHIEEDRHHEITIDTPSIIEIFPKVTHAVSAITDIGILECNSIADIVNDRQREAVVA
jgi:hypothetical protein